MPPAKPVSAQNVVQKAFAVQFGRHAQITAYRAGNTAKAAARAKVCALAHLAAEGQQGHILPGMIRRGGGRVTAVVCRDKQQVVRPKKLYQLHQIFVKARGRRGIAVHIIAVEKNEPFSAGVWKLTDELLDLAELSNKNALERFRACCISGVWPTGYEDLRIIDTL